MNELTKKHIVDAKSELGQHLLNSKHSLTKKGPLSEEEVESWWQKYAMGYTDGPRFIIREEDKFYVLH